MWETWSFISAGLPEHPVWDSIHGTNDSKEIPMDEPAQGVDVKISDEELKGRYSNLLRVTHTREEFILDFINLAPPQGVVTARVISSPGHVKRIIQALQTNLAQYEKTYGVFLEAPAPADGGVH
jgi:hypothetical protein